MFLKYSLPLFTFYMYYILFVSYSRPTSCSLKSCYWEVSIKFIHFHYIPFSLFGPVHQVWRGTIARMRYRRMRAAVIILRAYRRFKVKSYIKDVKRKFKNVRSMKDHGKHVKWPTPPKVLRRFEEVLRSFYNR